MRRGRPPAPVVLTDDERQALTSLAHRSRTAPQQARRARIILACADGQPTTGIAKRLHLSPTTVCKWRTRFLADRLDGLADEPRPGAPRRITDAQVEDVVVRTLESTPPGATHWSTRGMAKATGLSHTTISRIWRTFGLQPHRTETFKLSPDPLLIDKVRDVVGLYVNPPEARGRVPCRREAADSGPRTHGAAVADAAGPSRAAQLRLPPPRHDLVVRGPRRQRPARSWARCTAAIGRSSS